MLQFWLGQGPMPLLKLLQTENKELLTKQLYFYECCVLLLLEMDKTEISSNANIDMIQKNHFFWQNTEPFLYILNFLVWNFGR